MGKKKATIKDVAELAGVHHTSVSRVFRDAPGVSDKKKEDILKAAKRLNYRPNLAARALRGNQVKHIGVLARYIDSGFFSRVLWGVNQAAQGNHKYLLCSFAWEEDEYLKLYDSLIKDGQIGGLLLLAPPMSLFTKRKPASDIPMILCSATCRESNNPWNKIDSIITDSKKTMGDILDTLESSGHTNIVYLAGPKDNFDAVERLNAFRAEMRKRKKINGSILKGGISDWENKEVAQKWIEKHKQWPDAFVTINDSAALSVIDVMKERGEIKSSQCSITGWDDSPYASLQGVSSVRMPMEPMGELCGQKILAKIASPKSRAVHEVLETHWESRKSSTWGARK